MRSRRVAHGCDVLLDVLVLAFAGWTLVYGACLLLRVPADWATAAGAAVGLACLALGRTAPRPGDAQPAPGPPRAGLVVAALFAATLAAAGAPWPAVWLLWIVVAAAATFPAPDRSPTAPTTGGAAAACAWAAALALLSLFVVRPNPDDTQYVRTATWVAERGTFPVRDIVYSDQRYEALFFPPWTSIEALHGCVARLLAVDAAAVVYLAAPPLGAAVAVGALWRLLRAWQVRSPALALSTALVVLLVAAFDVEQRTPGRFFVDRLWQGKAVFVAALVPLVFALLHEYAERPTRRGLALLAAAGVAGVGLTTTAIFVLPIVAAGALLARIPRAAAALAAYPLLAGGVTLVLGARNPDVSQVRHLAAGDLARESLGSGALAFVAVAAILLGPATVRRGRIVAGVALVAALLLAPGAPRLLQAMTGLGEVLWRVLWAVPAAALAGAAVASRGRLAAAAVCGGLLAWAALTGPPDDVRLASSPAWKRPPLDLADARTILAHARPGDLVLARQSMSQTLLAISTRVTTVNPRDFYTLALGRAEEGVRARTRLRLQGLAQPERSEAHGRSAHRDRAFVRRALRVLGVDIVCIGRGRRATRLFLAAAGYDVRLRTRHLVCRARR